MTTATSSFDGRFHPLRNMMLSGVGTAMGLTVLALLPFLIHQSALKHDPFRVNQVRIIPQTTDPFMQLNEKLEKPDEPDPPPPPEPEIKVKPPEMPDIKPPEMPELAPPETQIQPLMPETMSLQQIAPAAIHINTPTLSAINVQGVKVKPTTPQAVHGFAKAPTPNALLRPIAKVKAAQPIKRVNKIRFDMSEVDKKPTGISTMQPAYPYRARRLGIEGHVSVQFLVDREGKVHDLSILDAKPADMFEKTVHCTVPKWRFKPAQKDGRKVETWVRTTIQFQLKNT